MGFLTQEYWSGLLFPSPGDLPNPGIEPGSSTLQADALPSETWGKCVCVCIYICMCVCMYVCMYIYLSVCWCVSILWMHVSSVQYLSHVQLFVTPWTAACQASLSTTNSWSLLKPMSIEKMMPSNHLILCCPLFLLSSIFHSIIVFSNESALCITSGGQSIGVSASASVLPINSQDWFPLGLNGWNSL